LFAQHLAHHTKKTQIYSTMIEFKISESVDGGSDDKDFIYFLQYPAGISSDASICFTSSPRINCLDINLIMVKTRRRLFMVGQNEITRKCFFFSGYRKSLARSFVGGFLLALHVMGHSEAVKINTHTHPASLWAKVR
jgi:hypothetical protein